MNKGQRKELEDLNDILTRIQDEEQEKYDNAPEGLEDSPVYERIQECLDLLDEIVDSMNNLLEV